MFSWVAKTVARYEVSPSRRPRRDLARSIHTIAIRGLTVFAASFFWFSPVFAQAIECHDTGNLDQSLASDLFPDLELIFSEFPAFKKSFVYDLNALCLADNLVGLLGYYEPEMRRVVIQRKMDAGLRQAALIHELRHLQQFDVGACPAQWLSMKENARAVFAMEADASVAALVVATRLRDLGSTDTWASISEWPMQADIAVAFGASLTEFGDITKAAESAFQTWYRNDKRRDAYYVASCLEYLEREERDHRIQTYEKLGASFFLDLCVMPNTGHYTCVEPQG